MNVLQLSYDFERVRHLALGRDSSVGIATGYRLDGPGSNPGGEIFSAPVQTCPGAHRTSCAIGTASFPGVKRSGCDDNRPPHLVPRLKKEWSFTSAPPLRLHGRLQGELYLFRTRSKPVVQYVPG